MSTLENLNTLFQRDLDKLTTEISAYNNETSLWLVKDEISNSSGNLALHLCGNLKHFIGAVLGNTGYIRKRDEEFSLKNIPRAEILREIEATKVVLEETLLNLTTEDLTQTYPREVLGKFFNTEFFLMHLAAHLSYHLGQINYHRRLLS